MYGLFRPRPSAAVVPAAAAYVTSVSSPSRSSFRPAKLPPLTVRLAAVRCIERAKGLFRHASRITSRNDAPVVDRIASPDLLPGEHRCLRISATEGRHDVDDESGGEAGASGGWVFR